MLNLISENLESIVIIVSFLLGLGSAAIHFFLQLGKLVSLEADIVLLKSTVKELTEWKIEHITAHRYLNSQSTSPQK